MNSEIILSLVSGAFIAFGTYLWQKGSYLVRHGRRAEAIVFDNKAQHDNDMIYYFPIVRFKTEENKEVAHELSIGRDTPLEKGTVVKIIYDPDDSATVEIDSATMLEIIPRVIVAIGFFGIVFVLLELSDITTFIE